MRLRLITAPTAEPLSLADAKEYLKVYFSEDDTLIQSQITAARVAFENAARVSLITQTRKVVYDVPVLTGFWLLGSVEGAAIKEDDPNDLLKSARLYRGPIVSINSVKLFKACDGTEVTADPSLYTLRDDRVYFKRDQFWPLYNLYNELTIEYVCGSTVDAFPTDYADILEALKIMVGNFYENRGYAMQQIPSEVAPVIARYWKPI